MDWSPNFNSDKRAETGRKNPQLTMAIRGKITKNNDKKGEIVLEILLSSLKLNKSIISESKALVDTARGCGKDED